MQDSNQQTDGEASFNPADHTDSQDSEVFTEKTEVSWTASEYINHHKSPAWYGALGGSIALAAAVIYLLSRDIISAVVVATVGLLFGVFASRKPEVRDYEVTNYGVRISGKLYEYDLFRSYAIHQEESIRSIFLSPVKRFMPGLSIYYPLDYEDTIVDSLAKHLPFEDGEPDIIDRFMSKIRF